MRKFCEDKLIDVIRSVVIEAKSVPECYAALSWGVDEGGLDELWELAKVHQLEHLVGYCFSEDEDAERALIFMSFAAVTMQQAEAAEDISSALSAIGVPHILLKGAVLRKVYPEGWMRNSCDVDVLVSEKDLERAGEAILALGYEKQGVVTVHDVAYLLENVRVELHYRLIEDYRMPAAAAVLGRIWSAAVGSDRSPYSLVLSDEMFYFYHVAHMAKHFGDGGCGVRAVLDLWMLNHRCEFDREKRDALLREGGVLAFEAKMRGLADYWFSDGDGDGLEFIERYVLDGGAYGDVTMSEEVRVRRKGKIRYLFDRLFMPYSELSKKYPRLAGRPYLLPVYEVRRWFSALGKNRRKYIGELKDTEHKEELDDMLRELEITDFR